MDEKVKLFIEQVGYMGNKLDEYSNILKSLYNMLSQYPDEVYLMIPEKQKIKIFADVITLMKVFKHIDISGLEDVLKRRTAKLYGVKLDILTGGKK